MDLICHQRWIVRQRWKAPAPLTVSFMRRFVKLGHLSPLAAVADALIDVVICSVEGFRVPSVSAAL